VEELTIFILYYLGYEDPPAVVYVLDDGVYYNKYMYGNNIKMSQPLSDGLVEYSDGTTVASEKANGQRCYNIFNVGSGTAS
jgi:hypothetical protein